MYSLISFINSINARTRDTPQLFHLSLSQIILFIRLCINIRHDILLVQPPAHDPVQAPTQLSPSIIQFLASSCSLELHLVHVLWGVLRDMVWEAEDDIFLLSIQNEASFERLFEQHGHILGFTSSRTLWPSVKKCTNDQCKFSSGGFKLHTVTQKHAVILTLGHGPVPAWAVHFRCNGCNTTYHHNFRVQNNVRTYHSEISDIIQIGEHCFAERKLLDSWRILMSTAWVSGSNCMLSYLQLHPDATLPPSWNISLNLTHRTAYDGFILYSLWLDSSRRDSILRLPHTAAGREHFTDAIAERNQRIKTFGQPEKRHYCNTCRREFPPQADGPRTTHVNVCDGVVMGRFRCGFGSCQEPLESTKDHFCLLHAHHNDICCVTGCSQPRSDSTRRTCSKKAHSQAEDRYLERGKAAFQLKARLQRARQVHPDAFEPIPIDELLDDASDDESDDDEDSDDDDDGDGDGDQDDQLILCPCGMIIARETFFHSESLPSVANFFIATYWDGFCPDHFVFDNNCGLAKMVMNEPVWWPVFKHVGLAVDVFHFKCKHKESDLFCQQHCNPATSVAI
ncbi:hypothetical protein BDZ89DRAFT_970301 [Hymenopellis radicata]|nr:hypothetical protein BDZ89DRAFT_970301 [Hymenopellis radicata]